MSSTELRLALLYRILEKILKRIEWLEQKLDDDE